MMDDRMERLNGVFQQVFDDDELEIDRETTAKDVEGWDSLMHVTLLINVEKAFGVKFSSSEVAVAQGGRRPGRPDRRADRAAGSGAIDPLTRGSPGPCPCPEHPARHRRSTPGPAAELFQAVTGLRKRGEVDEALEVLRDALRRGGLGPRRSTAPADSSRRPSTRAPGGTAPQVHAARPVTTTWLVARR